MAYPAVGSVPARRARSGRGDRGRRTSGPTPPGGGPRALKDVSRISREAKGRAAWYGAPLSYSVLHPDGSLERHVDADAEDAGSRATIQFLGVVGHMQAQHAEPDVRPDHPADVRLRGAATRLV